MTAGPVVRDIVKAYYDKKSGMRVQEYTAKKEATPKVVPTAVDGAPVLRGAILAAVDQARAELLASVADPVPSSLTYIVAAFAKNTAKGV